MKVNRVTARIWYGNSGMPPLPLEVELDVVVWLLVVLEEGLEVVVEVVLVGVVVLVELDVVVLV